MKIILGTPEERIPTVLEDAINNTVEGMRNPEVFKSILVPKIEEKIDELSEEYLSHSGHYLALSARLNDPNLTPGEREIISQAMEVHQERLRTLHEQIQRLDLARKYLTSPEL